MMKLLVTGSNGQLGNEIKMLATAYPAFEFMYTDVGELDITSEIIVEEVVASFRPAAIINCAAYTAVDKAEQDQKTAFLINSDAVGILARAATKYNAVLVQISTDYVFDGTGFQPYKETDTTNPVSVYAKSKYSGEQQVLQFSNKALIIRTSWLYSEFGNNFVKTILKYGKERGQLNVVFDQTGTPTYARDLAKVILDILAQQNISDGVEIFHFSNEGVTSWYDFAKSIVEFSRIECIINPIETKDYPLPASRPFYSVLNKSRIRERFGIGIPFWRDSLRECLARMNY